MKNDKPNKVELKDLYIEDLGAEQLDQVTGGGKRPPITTLALGEEDPDPTTLAIGEEDSGTTLALGEEDVKSP